MNFTKLGNAVKIKELELPPFEKSLQDEIEWLNKNCLFRNSFRFSQITDDVILSACYLFCKIDPKTKDLIFDSVEYQLMRFIKGQGAVVRSKLNKTTISFDNIELHFGSRQKSVESVEKLKRFKYLQNDLADSKLQKEDIAFTDNLKNLMIATYSKYHNTDFTVGVFGKIINKIKGLFKR